MQGINISEQSTVIVFCHMITVKWRPISELKIPLKSQIRVYAEYDIRERDNEYFKITSKEIGLLWTFNTRFKL